MSLFGADYDRLVLDDIKTYEGLYRVVKSNLLERLLIRKTKMENLHPNPVDEFSIPSIGPNMTIVHDYEKAFRRAVQNDIEPIEEPLIIEKMSTGGYLLLNGHHRWFAAHRISAIKKVPVSIVNVVNEEDVLEIIDKSNNTKCVSFDLDEILLTDGKIYPKSKSLLFPFNLIYKYNLRFHASALINLLRSKGYDVWVYTGNYYSEEYIRFLFLLNHTRVDGVVNGVKNKKSNNSIKDIFKEKYKKSLHIDNNGVIAVDTTTKEYEIYDVETTPQNWAADVIKTIENNNI